MRLIFIFLFILNYWFQDKPVELDKSYFLVSQKEIATFFADTLRLTSNTQFDSFVKSLNDPYTNKKIELFGKNITFNTKDSSYALSDFDISIGADPDNPGTMISSPGGYYTKDKFIIDNINGNIKFRLDSNENKNILYHIIEKTNTKLTLIRINQ